MNSTPFAAPAQEETTPPQAGGASSSSAPAPHQQQPDTPECLLRVQLLPLRQLPAELQREQQRRELLREMLDHHRASHTFVEAGMVLQARGHKFVVVKCSPERGMLTESTIVFDEGPPLKKLRRVQFMCLKKHEASDTNQTWIRDHIGPYFKARLKDTSRCAVVNEGEALTFGNLRFYVYATDPCGIGIIDPSTTFFVARDDADEFNRIHVVPFSDTLPSAYNFNVFQDYVKPFFASHVLDNFEEGKTFSYSSVQFKVVAVEPAGPRRVGLSTEIFTEGRLHPTVANLLPPDQVRRLATFPLGMQMILLQTDMFGDGEIADRIMQAQERHARARQASFTSSLVGRLTDEDTWSESYRNRLQIGQTECIVCLCDFEDGERIRRLPCNHVFHTVCVDEWLGRDAHCPLCRHGLRQSRR